MFYMNYCVITYIFGKNKEILRDPLVIDNNIEYICVTDQKDLKSKIWKIIYDEIPQAKCIRDKMVYVKYNPFKYTEANIICVIDGTLEITQSLIPLFEQVKDNDLLIKLHPERNNLFAELCEWIKTQGMEKEAVNKFQVIANHEKLDLNKKFLLESCVIVYTKKTIIQELCEEEISLMKFLGNNGNLFLSNQCVFTLLIQKAKVKFEFINQKDFFKRYNHGTTKLHNR